MALNKTTLANLWKAKIQALSNLPETGVSPIFSDDRVLIALAEGIVEHIVAAAEVLPDTLNNPAGQPVTVSIPSGVGATTAPQVIAGKGKVS